MKALILTAAAALTLATVAPAGGHSDADPAVAARHAQMQLFSFNLAILGNMAQGKADYDAAAAQAAADNLAAVSGMDVSAYWAEGTAEGSRALPAIWENLDDFMAKNAAVNTAAVAMAAVAGTDLESLQTAMGDLGGTCSACHREYRARQ